MANTLAELSERIGADWGEIAPSLKLDKRIGRHSYLSPGLGLAGGNLERDLATVLRMSEATGTEAGLIRAFVYNSQHRRHWALRTLHEQVARRLRRLEGGHVRLKAARDVRHLLQVGSCAPQRDRTGAPDEAEHPAQDDEGGSDLEPDGPVPEPSSPLARGSGWGGRAGPGHSGLLRHDPAVPGTRPSGSAGSTPG